MDDDDTAPPDIVCEDQILGLDLHPTHDVVALGQVSGVVELYTYAEAANTQVLRFQHHTDSCRSAKFSEDGNFIYTVSADKSVMMMDRAGAVAWSDTTTHQAAVNCMERISPGIIATGDDDGTVNVWDIRQQKRIVEFKENTDFISDFAVHPDGKHLLATSGDATLSVFDLGSQKLIGKSDDMEDELLSVQVMKRGKKVICGTQDGVLMLFNWGHFGDMNDRFPGHPQSIDAILKVDEGTVITGSSDGMLRICSVLPNKLLGIAGDHGEFPIERMQFSRDQRLVASISHDSTVKFWDISYLQEDDGDGEGEGEDETIFADGAGGGASGTGMEDSMKQKHPDDDDSDEDSEDSDMDEDEKPAPMIGRNIKKKGKGGGTEDFFDDL
jgi:WD40 repeat protein